MFNSLFFSLKRIFSPTKVKLLVIGLEHSKYAGDCPGAGTGSTKLFKLIKPRCCYSKFLLNENANKTNVINELNNVCNSDLAIIVYCGHGGQKSGKQNETDGKDEFLGLYDGQLVDNEIWNIISKAKGRVFCIFDCCHAETMFREFNFERSQEPIDLICWSACADDKLSYALAERGGFFSTYILKHVKWNKTYEQTWKEIASAKNLLKHETVKQTVLIPESNFRKKQIFS